MTETSKQFNHDKTIGKDEYLTPPAILKTLGDFDLDPCAPVIRPWNIAAKHYTIKDNGLALPWKGRAFVNPPYGSEVGIWMKHLWEHKNGIGLIFGRTDTNAWFDYIWTRADAALFLKGRLTFYTIYGEPVRDKNGKPSPAGAPSVLLAYGKKNVDTLYDSGLEGAFVPLKDVVILGRKPTIQQLVMF